MTAIPHDPLVRLALGLARSWCAGHIIDGAPALGHAVRVAGCLYRHIPEAPAEWIAAALLHDGPDFAPAGADLANLTNHETARIVRALQREHAAIAVWPTLPIDVDDPPIVRISAADKIVSLDSILGRASRAADPGAYWSTRGAFITQVPYFRAFHSMVAGRLPALMAKELEALVGQAERVAGA